MSKITVKDKQITVLKVNDEDYLSLTDMLKAKDGDFFITDWLRNRNTLEYTLSPPENKRMPLRCPFVLSVNPGRYGDSKASGGKPRRQVARAQMITFLTESEPISPSEVAFAL